MVVLHLVPALIKQQAAPRLNAVLSVLPSPTKQLARHQLVLRQPRRVSLLALQEKLKPLVQLRIPAPLHVQPASTQMLPASALLGLSVVTKKLSVLRLPPHVLELLLEQTLMPYAMPVSFFLRLMKLS